MNACYLATCDGEVVLKRLDWPAGNWEVNGSIPPPIPENLRFDVSALKKWKTEEQKVASAVLLVVIKGSFKQIF